MIWFAARDYYLRSLWFMIENGNSEQDITEASNLYRICLPEHKTI
ncbi:hypothetical protein APHMUC_0187 [Anaplasma phagocytophilum str. ApMUC09]|uniref:Uncharacterized protein n=1 Tax=Anaplasma phagocytophilum str. ApMUC09 TaxID=1359152 RepID=A0A0F3NDC7_ANAPH|nr:hypothetical protein APHMUC_0187 [Anaplasma phagocytophilum str. ApMUC09]